MRNRIIVGSLAAAGLMVTAACGGDSPAAETVEVTATDTACTVNPTSAPTGTIAFEVTNDGTRTTEFYLYGPDDSVVSEVEGIGVGLSRTMTVDVTEPGTYTTACKPGMKGDGIRAPFEIN